MPSGVSPSLVTQIILVSALVYWAGSRTKSKTSSGVTPLMTTVPSPRTAMRLTSPRVDVGSLLPCAGWSRRSALEGGGDPAAGVGGIDDVVDLEVGRRVEGLAVLVHAGD